MKKTTKNNNESKFYEGKKYIPQKFTKIFTMTLLMLSFSGITSLMAKPSGLQIIKNVYNRPTGNDMQANLTMKLINSSGNQRVRKIKQFTKDFGSKEKKIMFFISPADIRNTSFMTISYDSGRADDQWIYLPALKKVKRISNDSKSDYFMGSDFTYDDLGDRHPNQDRHKILREEKFKGQDCYVIESKPKDSDYMYSKTITWIIKGKWIGLKKIFYDEDGSKLKTLSVNNYKKINGYWIILSSTMKNIQKNHITKMNLSNVKINRGISSRKFSTRMMKRGLR